MSDFYDELNLLMNNIINGKVDKKETEKIIREMKNTYGDDVFPSFPFEKQSKPWTKTYFNSLRTKNIMGACSEEFILHMAEVSEDICLKKKRAITGGVIAAICIVLLIVIISITITEN